MRFIYFFILTIVLNSCINTSQKELDKTSIFNDNSLGKIEAEFLKSGIKGCFILHDVENDTSIIYNQARTTQQFLPASTFKILNSLIALECEVIQNENEIIAWDSVERVAPAWNKDHNLRTGIKYSVVWFYQELARRIGVERMQSWVNDIEYGNRNIGNKIDDFWLVGDLRITPMEQLEFLKRFSVGDLPFKQEHIKTVQEMLVEDQTDQYIFRAKTGWADKGQAIGWYVGYIILDGKTFIFINNIDINSNKDAKARQVIVKEIFKELLNIDLSI